MIFNFKTLVSYMSLYDITCQEIFVALEHHQELEGMNPPKFLKDGDEMF
jgi:hypothetical protein